MKNGLGRDVNETVLCFVTHKVKTIFVFDFIYGEIGLTLLAAKTFPSEP